ncbi:uncharacterized protein BcabD6B2_05050 [Babesia caballi]|uniref:Uncharacterized protein n=1 Tax=Babesia caballi TaxID=5871 RepID=A0AAV4LMP4_BABCB|nr:hypothetical protein, conserved [Babesia caballi]
MAGLRLASCVVRQKAGAAGAGSPALRCLTVGAWAQATCARNGASAAETANSGIVRAQYCGSDPSGAAVAMGGAATCRVHLGGGLNCSVSSGNFHLSAAGIGTLCTASYRRFCTLNCKRPVSESRPVFTATQRRSVATAPKTDEPGTEWRRRVVGSQPLQNLKVGPYKRGKWFVSYKDDPGSFITNILILLVTGYSIFTMLPGESMSVRRQRKMRQLLLDNAQMTEADLLYIENYRLPEEDK